jgi:sugar phosphate permease
MISSQQQQQHEAAGTAAGLQRWFGLDTGKAAAGYNGSQSRTVIAGWRGYYAQCSCVCQRALTFLQTKMFLLHHSELFVDGCSCSEQQWL